MRRALPGVGRGACLPDAAAPCHEVDREVGREAPACAFRRACGPAGRRSAGRAASLAFFTLLVLAGVVACGHYGPPGPPKTLEMQGAPA